MGDFEFVLLLFFSCDAKENEIQLERQTLRERQKVLQQSQEGLLDGQALFNQREEYILHRSHELSKLEKQLEASKSALEDERRGLNEEKQKLELMTKSLDAREEVSNPNFLAESCTKFSVLISL